MNPCQADVDGLSVKNEIKSVWIKMWKWKYPNRMQCQATFCAGETEAACFDVLCRIVSPAVGTFQSYKVEFHRWLLKKSEKMRLKDKVAESTLIILKPIQW